MRQVGTRYCTQIMPISRASGRDQQTDSDRAFDDAEIFALIRAQAISSVFHSIEFAADKECASKSRARADVSRLAIGQDRARPVYNRLSPKSSSSSRPSMSRNRCPTFKAFDLSAFPHGQQMARVRLRARHCACNSSTNFNRKRVGLCAEALLLRRPDAGRLRGPAGARGRRAWLRHLLLCLPLQARPDGRLLPQSTARYFYDYSRDARRSSSTISPMHEPAALRGDLARAQGTRTRKWNVGYVRSPRWENQNSYGETLGDLSRIIREAPGSASAAS